MKTPKGQTGYRKPGDRVWFEYRCEESPGSEHAEWWYRSHQRVKILKLNYAGIGKDQNERAEEGCPAGYDVQFKDGFIGEAMEDELLDSPKEFTRPDPPKPRRRNPGDPDIRRNPPTGTCYRDALMAVAKDLPVGPRGLPLSSFKNVTIVHGKARVTDAETGQPKIAGHAWVEFDTPDGEYKFVYDPLIGVMAHDEYYQALAAVPEKRYTKPLELIGVGFRTGHYGPYNPRSFRRNRPETMWHGTSSVLAPRILTEGFVPDPKKKRWSEDEGYRASLFGTYFTNNWMTAKAAAGNAVDKFGGNPVIFEVVIELRSGLIDEDHLPRADMVLARANNLAFLGSRMMNDIIRYDRGHDVADFVEKGVGEYWRALKPHANSIDPRAYNAITPRIREYLTATFVAAAETKSGGGWGGAEYMEGKHFTPRVMAARESLLLGLRGLLNDVPAERFQRDIRNVRIDRPVRFKGANRIVGAVEIIYPTDTEGRWTSSEPDNPFRLHVLYGKMTPEWLENFDKHIGGHRVIEVAR